MRPIPGFHQYHAVGRDLYAHLGSAAAVRFCRLHHVEGAEINANRTANITEAEAFHTWAENEGISHRFDVDMDKLWLTVYATSPTQIESCNDWMSTHRTGCYTA